MNEKLKKAIELLEEYEYEHAYDEHVCVNAELKAIKEKVGWIWLNDCPFCGSTSYVEIETDVKPNSTTYAVNCNYIKGGCGATGGYRINKEEAVGVWNRRN